MTEWTPEAQEQFFSKLYEEVAEPDDQPEDVAQKVASAVGGVTRREMLAGAGILGGGALLGGGGTAALTGNAQAAASTVDGDGDIGTPDNPEDVYADAVAVFDGASNQIGSFDETGITTPSVDTDKASIKTQSDRFLYAAAYDGADIDSRLSSALSDASAGDTIILEKGLYGDATIDQRVTMQGATNRSGSVCAISGTWTLSDRAVLQGVRVDSGASVEADADFIEVSQASHAGSININGSKTLIYGCVGGSVTFASGTSAGLVDACSGMSVTDNGSNTVRDIA